MVTDTLSQFHETTLRLVHEILTSSALHNLCSGYAIME